MPEFLCSAKFSFFWPSSGHTFHTGVNFAANRPANPAPLNAILSLDLGLLWGFGQPIHMLCGRGNCYAYLSDISYFNLLAMETGFKGDQFLNSCNWIAHSIMVKKRNDKYQVKSVKKLSSNKKILATKYQLMSFKPLKQFYFRSPRQNLFIPKAYTYVLSKLNTYGFSP